MGTNKFDRIGIDSERQLPMQHIYSLQRQQRKRRPSASASVSFAEPTRLFASGALPFTSTLPYERQEHLAPAAQFKHTLDRIAIRLPVSSGETGYKLEQSDMRSQSASLQRKEIERQPMSQEDASLQLFKQKSPASGDTFYTVQPGDTLSKIAEEYHTTWQVLAQYNQIKNPDRIDPNEEIDIPADQANPVAPKPENAPSPPENAPKPEGAPPSTDKVPKHNTSNLFPTGQCTWWANQRYHELTGYYVPWTINSNANQWSDRAREFGWRVSTEPSEKAIIDFQAGVQLASDVGHVAIVEKINSDGSLTTSNMNVLGQPGKVVDLTNHAGPGVTFITYG